jgi:hypothetical protein
VNSTKPILYDLGISISAISLWLTPIDAVKLIGYSTSLVFAGDAYLRGLTLISKERRADEKSAIAYEAEVDYYDQILAQTNEAKLEIAALEVETRMIERLIPLVEQKNRLEQRLMQVSGQKPVEPISEPSEVESVSEDTEVDFRSTFPAEMDGMSWKAICKALGDGLGREEIIKDVLDCTGSQGEVGNAYFTFLKSKFLDG